MKATEFCYWLQGLFELANPETLSSEQIECIKRHAALVTATAANDSAKCLGFMQWLEVSLDWLDGQRPEHVTRIKTKLADIFEHVIDKMYGPDGKLNEIHNPPHLRPKDGSGIVARC